MRYETESVEMFRFLHSGSLGKHQIDKDGCGESVRPSIRPSEVIRPYQQILATLELHLIFALVRDDDGRIYIAPDR